MNKPKQIAKIMLTILLGTVAYGLFRTGRSITTSQIIPGGERSEAAHGSAIDQTPLYTARRLAQMPTSGDELPLAQEALRLGDREMDHGFCGGGVGSPSASSPAERRSETDSRQAPKGEDISRRRQGTSRATYPPHWQRRPVLNRTAWKINWNRRKSR